MVGFPLNVGNIMSRVIYQVGNETKTNFPFPNTLSLYFRELKVKKKRYDVTVPPVAPYSWYDQLGPDNPKKGKKTPASTSSAPGQSEEPVATEQPSDPTPDETLPPGPSSTAGPSVASDSVIHSSKTHRFTANQLAHSIASLNNRMSVATSKLSSLTTVVQAQGAPATVEIPSAIEDVLKKILANQEKMMATQDTLTKAVGEHGKALEKLAREHKKLRKQKASKELVAQLRGDVDKLLADQMPFDLLFGDPAGEPAAEQPQAEEDRPRKKRKLPNTEGILIEVAPPSSTADVEPSSVPPVDKQDHEQTPAPAAQQQQAGDQFDEA